LYKNILIPTDGSELAAKAIEQGVLFAKEIGAKITAMTVTEPFHLLSVAPSQLEYTPIEYKKHTEAHAEKVLGTVTAAAELAGVTCETLHVEHEQVYQAIIDAASARRCDLIVMTSHGRRGVSAVVLGSETVKVLTHSSIPVLVYRRARPSPFTASFCVLDGARHLQARPAPNFKNQTSRLSIVSWR